MLKEVDLPINKIVCADALDLISTWPDGCIDVIITDPPWPDVAVTLPGQDKVFAEWGTYLYHFARLASRLIVIIGCDTDVRFLSKGPTKLPFLRVCYLEYVPPRPKGSVLYTADIAYVFGKAWLPGNGQRVLPGKKASPSQGVHDPQSGDHPCPRRFDHMDWLVKNFTRPGHIVLDPFAGTGTISAAALLRDRLFIGIDIDPHFCEIAAARIKAIDGSFKELLLYGKC